MERQLATHSRMEQVKEERLEGKDVQSVQAKMLGLNQPDSDSDSDLESRLPGREADQDEEFLEFGSFPTPTPEAKTHENRSKIASPAQAPATSSPDLNFNFQDASEALETLDPLRQVSYSDEQQVEASLGLAEDSDLSNKQQFERDDASEEADDIDPGYLGLDYNSTMDSNTLATLEEFVALRKGLPSQVRKGSSSSPNPFLEVRSAPSPSTPTQRQNQGLPLASEEREDLMDLDEEIPQTNHRHIVTTRGLQQLQTVKYLRERYNVSEVAGSSNFYS